MLYVRPGDIFTAKIFTGRSRADCTILTYLCVWSLPYESDDGEVRYCWTGALELGKSRLDELRLNVGSGAEFPRTRDRPRLRDLPHDEVIKPGEVFVCWTSDRCC